jgi:hypothetical protein
MQLPEPAAHDVHARIPCGPLPAQTCPPVQRQDLPGHICLPHHPSQGPGALARTPNGQHCMLYTMYALHQYVVRHAPCPHLHAHTQAQGRLARAPINTIMAQTHVASYTAAAAARVHACRCIDILLRASSNYTPCHMPDGSALPPRRARRWAPGRQSVSTQAHAAAARLAAPISCAAQAERPQHQAQCPQRPTPT